MAYKDPEYQKHRRAKLIGEGKCNQCYRNLTSNGKKSCTDCLEYKRIYARELHDRVIAGYGSLCVCCGETNPAFLTIDHIYGQGYADRRSTYSFYRRLEKEGFPKDRFQLLCMNCNWAKGVEGTCPHQSE